MPQTDAYERARGHAKAKYVFFVHVSVFVSVIGLLALINLITSPGYFWFIWPMVGWGLAVVLHGAQVFLFSDRQRIIDAMTEAELRRSGDDAHSVK